MWGGFCTRSRTQPGFHSAARDKQFTFLLAWGHVLPAIVQGRSGLSDPDREEVGLSDSTLRKKMEQSGPTWGDSEISNLLIRETEQKRESVFQICSFMCLYLLSRYLEKQLWACTTLLNKQGKLRLNFLFFKYIRSFLIAWVAIQNVVVDSDWQCHSFSSPQGLEIVSNTLLWSSQDVHAPLKLPVDFLTFPPVLALTFVVWAEFRNNHWTDQHDIGSRRSFFFWRTKTGHTRDDF